MATEDMLAVPQVLSPLQGLSAGHAARLAAKSAGVNLDDPYGANDLGSQVMQNLRTQGIEADPAMVKSMIDQMAKAGLINKGLVTKATDPVISPQPYVAPADFSAQYPIPLDPTEILTLCEEITTWRVLPEVVTDYSTDQWREMTSLDFTGDGLTYEGFFLPGACPEEYTHDGANRSETRRYLGGKKSLTNEEIRHSMAVARIQGLGISQLATQLDGVTQIIGVKEKEMVCLDLVSRRRKALLN